MSAFEVFAATKDSKDFLENLRMIKNKVTPSPTNGGIDCEKYCNWCYISQPTIIDIYADAYAQIEMLQKQQGWSDENANFLKRLVSNNDPVISGALECFRITKDENDIAETFGLIIQLKLMK